MTLFELLGFLLCVACGVAVGTLAWFHLGGLGCLLGFPAGFFGLIGLLTGLRWLDDQLHRGCTAAGTRSAGGGPTKTPSVRETAATEPRPGHELPPGPIP